MTTALELVPAPAAPEVSASPDTARRAEMITAALVVFFANAALLVLQLVAGRLLAPFIGVALETWTAIIGVFLAGISLGNAAGGRLASRASPRMLGVLLLLGAASIAGSFLMVRLLSAAGVAQALPILPRIAAVSFLVCFPPAFLLSLLTPAAIQIALPDLSRAGRVVGLIYAVGTLGSLVGNFVTGFVLIAYLDVNVIVLGTAAGLVLLAVPALLGSGVPAVAPTGYARPAAPASEGLRVGAACAAVFLASFCSMALEMTASRLLAPMIGVSLYSWTGIIGVVLAGVVCGSSLGGWLADRHGGRGTLRATVLVSAVFVLCVVLGFHALARVVPSSGPLIPRILLWSAALFFLPMVLLGTITPQVTRLALRDEASAGLIAGQIYAWSCAGAIAGTFAAGWLLISALGTFAVVLSLAGVLALLSLALPRGSQDKEGLSARVGLLAAAAAVLWLCGVFRSPYQMETNYFAIRVLDGEWEGEKVKTLALDHLVHSHVKPGDPTYLGYPHEKAQAEFVRAIAGGSDPRLLVIGGGGYTLPRWVEVSEPGVVCDVVEIDPGVTEAARRYLNLPDDTAIVTHSQDGRQFIQERAAPASYPLVIQDAVNDMSVPFHILTREYNDLVKRALTPGGVYLLTVIDDYEEGELLRAAVRTMRLTFKHVHLVGSGPVWQPKAGADAVGRTVFIIYGSDRPVDLPAMAEAVRVRGGGPLQTAVQPEALTEEYVRRGRDIVLTDAYAPVDNLFCIVSRKR